jgi:glycerol-3-phosphate acyltransferase PlsX
VTVTDGFTGNVALKALEGAVHMVAHELRRSFQSSLWAKIVALLAKSSFKRLKSRIDPSHYNGAVFLGVKGIAVKSHGDATAFGFSSAIYRTKTMAGMGLIQKLEDRLQHLPPEFLKK